MLIFPFAANSITIDSPFFGGFDSHLPRSFFASNLSFSFSLSFFSCAAEPHTSASIRPIPVSVRIVFSESLFVSPMMACEPRLSGGAHRGEQQSKQEASGGEFLILRQRFICR